MNTQSFIPGKLYSAIQSLHPSAIANGGVPYVAHNLTFIKAFDDENGVEHLRFMDENGGRLEIDATFVNSGENDNSIRIFQY